MRTYLASCDLQKILIRSILAVALGVFFCVFPGLSANLIFYVLGGVILFTGIVSFLAVLSRKDIRPGGMQYFNLGMSLIVGIALIASPQSFVKLLFILLGLILALSGISQILSLWSLRKWGVKPALAEYISAILLFALGVFICTYPKATNAFVFTLFGIGCIFYGLTLLLAALHMRKKLQKAGKNIVNGIIEDVDFELEEK